MAAAADSLAGKKPNIVFVLTDDQGYGDLSCHGNPILKTPNLDRLHDEGRPLHRLPRQPHLFAARARPCMTGRHEFKNGVTHTILERERLTPKATTLAQVLEVRRLHDRHLRQVAPRRRAGSLAEQRGFDEMFIHGCGGIGQTYPGSCGDAPGNTLLRPGDPAQRHVREDHRAIAPTSSSARPRSGSNRSRARTAVLLLHHAQRPALRRCMCARRTRHAIRDKVKQPNVAKFFGMIANIDDNVGRLLDKLKEWGLERDTLVIFMNDNGGTAGVQVFNAGMRGQKVTPWLGGTRAASFWRWPGTLKPGDCDRLAAHIDFFPTLAEIAGRSSTDDVKKQVEGRSLVPLLEDPWAELARPHSVHPCRTLAKGREGRRSQVRRLQRAHDSLAFGFNRQNEGNLATLQRFD